MNDKKILAQHRRAIREYLARNPKLSPQPWRQRKTTDIVAFNQGAEQRFTEWLGDKITASKTGSVNVTWAIANAAFELDVSVSTVKRYVMKWTADAAPFKSDGKEIAFRFPDMHTDQVSKRTSDHT